MSEVESLVSSIGFQVDLLSNQLKEEKAHLADVQSRLLSLVKEADAKKRSKACLEEELKALESSFERATSHSTDLIGASDLVSKENACLEKAIERIQFSSDRIRKERMALIAACKSKLNSFDNQLWANEKLKAFVQLWAAKKSSNFKLTALPDSIREIVHRLVGYYDESLESLLDQALDNDTCTTLYNAKDTDMSVATGENHPYVSQDNIANVKSGVEVSDSEMPDSEPNTRFGVSSCLTLSALDFVTQMKFSA
ncbi:unnamed protein product [Dicrocoelium dendriticum]|nr:unnamed protein product [Dicrocoelium dendriticum]